MWNHITSSPFQLCLDNVEPKPQMASTDMAQITDLQIILYFLFICYGCELFQMMTHLSKSRL